MCEQPATHRMLSAGAAASRAACGMGMAGWISVGLGGWLVAGFWMAHTFGVAAKDDPVACRATAKLAGQRHVGWPVWPASEWV